MGLGSVMRNFKKLRQQTFLAALAAGLASAVTSASATEGYFIWLFLRTFMPFTAMPFTAIA